MSEVTYELALGVLAFVTVSGGFIALSIRSFRKEFPEPAKEANHGEG